MKPTPHVSLSSVVAIGPSNIVDFSLLLSHAIFNFVLCHHGDALLTSLLLFDTNELLFPFPNMFLMHVAVR